MRIGFLMLSGWGGYREEKVEIIGITPKRYRVRALKRTKIAGRQRWLEPGESTLAPQDAVRVEPRPGCDTCGELEGVRQTVQDGTYLYFCRACDLNPEARKKLTRRDLMTAVLEQILVVHRKYGSGIIRRIDVSGFNQLIHFEDQNGDYHKVRSPDEFEWSERV